MASKTNWGMWFVKASVCSLAAGGLFYYAGQQSVTFNEIVTTFASLPLLVVILVEILDKFVDKSDVYKNIYAFVQTKNDASAYFAVFLTAVLAFFGILWLITGSLTLNVGTVSPAVITVAGLLTLYILAPETGDDEIILFLWVGATIATFGKYFTLIPHIPGFGG
ncbi:hypothetical protein [Methanotorris igneus]|uniref:Uncharacterized protein n=1 Tax=Methanotorris igneus (strain DSM 5666 / JCM 11834 / Kol 5) TaxID=880724 RepID=F6BBP4_METIK|nr:hypothetical protein [Methanotorris igneus]AEF96053.1 hypothetical protein Metig_0497 [Methanotorris igneus Kol 5]